MPLRASERNKVPATRGGISKAKSPAPATASARVPLGLAPLLAPYRKHGRLSLRLERLPQLARLSAGRNNGDGTWSLATDELEDLEYLFPESDAALHTLAVRIIGLDQSGTTLAILDVEVSTAGARTGDVQHAKDSAPHSRSDDAAQARLREEIKSLKDTLAARETELADLRAARVTETEASRQSVVSALAAGRESWTAELERELAKATAQSASAFEQYRKAWAAEHNARLAELEARAKKNLAEAEERWQRDRKDALTAAERVWRGEEAVRLAAQEAQWRERSAHALSELMARCDAAEAARARAESEASAKLDIGVRASRGLREELVAARRGIEERDAALVQARAVSERAQLRWRQESEKILSEAKARYERAETELARLEADAAARNDLGEDAARAAREEVAALRNTLAERDAALVQAREIAERQQQRWRQESEALLLDAKARWERAEAALAQAQSEAAARNDTDTERGLREELTAARTLLAERDAALAQHETALAERDAALAHARKSSDEALAEIRAASDDAQQRWRRESEALVANAKASWRTGEAARIAAAEAEWNKRSAAALAQATTRYEEAERALAQLRAKAARNDSDDTGRLREEIAALRTTLADRENEIANARVLPEQRSLSMPHISLHEGHLDEESRAETRKSKSSGRLIRDILVVAVLAASLIFFAPRLAGYLPESWQSDIARVTGIDLAPAAAPAPAEPHQQASLPTPVLPAATLIHGANMHADPATNGPVVATLPRGTKVEVIGQQNNWALVRTARKNTNAKAQQGWVYSPYLKIAP